MSGRLSEGTGGGWKDHRQHIGEGWREGGTDLEFMWPAAKLWRNVIDRDALERSLGCENGENI